MKIKFLLATIFFMSMQNTVYADSNPMISRVYGNQFTSEIAQTRSAGQIGMLDTTFNGTNSYITPSHGNYAYAVQALADGTFITLSSNSSTSSWLTKYNAQGVVVPSGFGVSGVLALAGYSNAQSMMVDPQGRLLIPSGDAGNIGGYSFILRIEPNGTPDTTWATSGVYQDSYYWPTNSQINQLAQKSTGEIIVAGFNGTNAQIACLTLNAGHNATPAYNINFGFLGFAVLSGVTTGLYNVVVDAVDNIYVAYTQSSSVYVIRLTPLGHIDTTWNGGHPFNLTYLNGSSMVTSQLRMIIDSFGDLIVAVPSGSTKVIKVTSIATSPSTTTPTTPGTFVSVTMANGPFGSSSNYDFRNMMATSDGSVYFIGSNTTSKQMMVARYTAYGILDTNFNGTGVNFFTIGSPTVNALLYAGSITSTGEIYVVGSQSTGGGPTVTPYVSRLYNTPYVTATPQFPGPIEQGILDLSFGATGTETYTGVTTMYNGLYASCMIQQTAAAIEVPTGSLATQGDILVGLNGLMNNIEISTMMFAWLTPAGIVDTSVNTTGYLTLANQSSGNNEYITAMIADKFGNIYISGYTSTSTTPTPPGNEANISTILRAYSTSSSFSGTALWSIPQVTTGWQGVGLSSQQNNRTLLCVDEGTAGYGHITSYIAGTLDTTFGDSGSGTISHNSFNLHMGPCYGLAVNLEGYVYAAYVDYSNSQVNVVVFEPNGSELVPTFGATSSGLTANIFSGSTIASNNVRIGFAANGNIVVGAVTSTHILVAFLNANTGAVIHSVSSAITGTSSLDLARLTSVSDGTIVITFYDSAGTKNMYVARVTSTGILDVTFNSQGSQQGVLPIQVGTSYTTQNASSALVQSTAGANQGNIVIVGSQSVTSLDARPMAMRVYGDLGSIEILSYPLVNNSPGTFETAYSFSSYNYGGVIKVLFTYPSTNVNAGKLLLGFDNTSSVIVRVYELDMSLDTTFGSGTGFYTTSEGINTISIDAYNNILVGGITNGYNVCWAQAINNAGTAATSFNIPTGFQVNQILQQQSGRYIVAGNASGQGLLIAFQDALVSPATTFAVDTTFNPLGVGGAAPGSYYVGTTGLYTMAINTTYNASPLCNIDTIAVAYKNSSNNSVMLSELTADGSGLVFGPITTGVTTDSSKTIRLNIDGSQNIVVGASRNTGGTSTLYVQRFDSDGTTTNHFTASGLTTPYVQTIPFTGSTSVTLTGLMETTSQQTVLTGYDVVAGSGTVANGPLFAARLTPAGALDPTWNAMPTSPDTVGLLTYSSGVLPSLAGPFRATIILGSSIALDGTIVSVGGNNIVPYLSIAAVMKVVGDTLVTQITQDPLEVASGTIDTTIPGGAFGSWNLSGTVPGIPAKVYMYSPTLNNGAMLIASADTTHVYVAKLNADLSLAGSNGSATFGTSGVVTISTSASPVTITDLYVANGTNDTAALIYVTGYTGSGHMWAAQIAANGSSNSVLSPISTLTTTGSIRQSTNSRILISGYNGSSGAIVAYNAAMTAIDTSFGNNNGTGYYTTGTATGIYAMAVDNSDRIYIAYQTSASQIKLQRLLENGTGLDTTFGSSGTVNISGTSLSATQIKMAIDLTNNQVVVAAQAGTGTGNVLQVTRYNYATNTQSTPNPLTTITLTGATLNLTDLFIDSVQNIYVIGYDSVANHAIIARVKQTSSTAITLDTSYATASATPGVASVAAGSMTIATSGALDPDRRVYLVGSGAGNGYMSRVFGNSYTTEISPAILQGIVGTLDLTLSPNNSGGIDLNTLFGSSILVGYTAYDVLANPNGDGTTFFAFGNGTNVIIGKVNPDMSPVTSFGGNSNGLTTAAAMATINSMTVDGQGNVIVSGVNGGSQQLLLYNASGSFQATFTNPYYSTIGTTVIQQKSGRYIVGGYSTQTGTAVIQAYQNASAIIAPGAIGTLGLETSFGPVGLNGIYDTGIVGMQIDDLCIDSNDDIYFVARNHVSPYQVYLGKITANGSGLVNAQNSPTTFNSGAIITTGLTASQPARIAINQAGNILVGTTTPTPNLVKVQLYNGSSGASITSPLTVGTFSSSLKKLVGSTTPNNEFYGIISNGAATVFAITSAGIVDTGFNAVTSTNPGGTPGYLSTSVQSINQVYGLTMQLDGKVVMVGSSSTPHPIYVRAYGYPYASNYAQTLNIVGAGVLDTTLWPSTGLFALNNTTNSTFNSALAGYAVKRIYESGNGLMTFVADNSSNSTAIFELQKDLTANTSFNTNGYTILSSNYGGTTGLFVNSGAVGSHFIVGNKSGLAWAQGVSATGGSLSPAFAPTSGFMGSVYAVNQEATGRVICAGLGTTTGGKQPNNDGYLVGFTTAGIPDTTFGTTSNGNVDMGFSGVAITDIIIDYYDNIITVANNSGTVILQKVTQDGTTVTNVSSAGTAITGAVGNIKVVFDAWGDIIVAAATSTGYIVRSYINDNTQISPAVGNTGQNNAPSAVSITVGSGSTVLSNMYTTFDGKIVLVGYDSSSGNTIVARLISTWNNNTPGAGTLTLDTGTFNVALTGGGTPQAGVLVASLSPINQCNDAIIHEDNRIMLAIAQSGTPQPYMARLFGDAYATYASESFAGLPGTPDVFFGSTTPQLGYYNLTTLALRRLTSVLLGYAGKAILAVSTGGYYMALDNGTNTLLIKTLSDGSLDPSFNSTAVTYPAGIAPDTAPIGVNSILMDGSGKILLTGTTGGAGWVQRYQSGTSGLIDTTFNSGVTPGLIAPGSTASVTVEQTLGRLVVAGKGTTYATLFAYESLAPYGTPGIVDDTFNSTGTPGYFTTTSYTHAMQNLVADQYDRLIFAILNNAGNAVDLFRLTPTGELDVTFGSNGIVTNVLTGISSSSQIKIAVDANNNIVIAATSSTTNTISVRAYDNGLLTLAGANGNAVYAQLNIPFLTNGPIVTGIATSSTGNTAGAYAVILGNQTTGSQTVNGVSGLPPSMWVARITPAGLLDSGYFNPAGLITLDGTGYSGGVPGIYQATFSTATANVYNAITVSEGSSGGSVGVFGYETISGTVTPWLQQANHDAGTVGVAQSPYSLPVGTNDPTVGAGSSFYYDSVHGTYYGTQAVTNGENYYGTLYSNNSYTQASQAVALLNQNNIVVAIDGTAEYTNNVQSQIYIDMFDNEGIFNLNFGTNGQATASGYYQNQYARDMVIFTVGGVNKAIIAGYTHDTILGIYGSLLMQYILNPDGTPTDSHLDTTFGGFNNNPLGLAVGDGKQAFTVGQQSMGRIIVGGVAQSGHGLLLGYTSSGKLDFSFGINGYQETNTGSTGIYTNIIDSHNRIVIAYNNSGTLTIARFLADGTGLDTTFGASSSGIIATGISITGLQSSVNNNFKIILDGSANIIAAAITGNGTTSDQLTVSSYASNGASRNHTITLTGGSGFAGSSSSTFTMGKLLADVQGNIIVVMYDTYPTQNTVVMTRLTSTLGLDTTTFNAPNGYLTYHVGSGNTQTANDALIHPDGRIIVVGSNS